MLQARFAGPDYALEADAPKAASAIFPSHRTSTNPCGPGGVMTEFGCAVPMQPSGDPMSTTSVCPPGTVQQGTMCLVTNTTPPVATAPTCSIGYMLSKDGTCVPRPQAVTVDQAGADNVEQEGTGGDEPGTELDVSSMAPMLPMAPFGIKPWQLALGAAVVLGGGLVVARAARKRRR